MRLPQRSNSAIEWKHRNISAILAGRRLAYIEGYKPAWNHQRYGLEPAVEKYVESHPAVVQMMLRSPRLNVETLPETPTLLKAFEAPPEEIALPQLTLREWRSERGRKVDFAQRDAQNRRMGSLGESFVLNLERMRLAEAKRDDLARKVSWIAEDWGDGAGFDVLSFDENDESEMLIEVKTTGAPKYFPFYVTANELTRSIHSERTFYLYRVFDFGQQPRVYVLRGALSEVCKLEPTLYRAGL